MGSILGGGDGGAKKAAKQAQAAANTAADQTVTASQGAATGITQGSQTAADAQQQALQYLQQTDQLPTELRENALRQLGGIFSSGNANVGQMITDRAMASPLYKTAVEQGENSVLRNASATGGLRSGNANEALAQANQNALLAAYNQTYGEYQNQIQGIQGLASLPSNANNIAGYMAGVGNTLGQGQMNSAQALANGQISAAQTRAQGATGAAQTQAQGAQNSANNTTALVGMGLTAAMMFSDRRLKADIVFTGEENGIRKYRWTWNKLAAALGLHGPAHGVIADEVAKTHPDAVSTFGGYMAVNYQKLGVSHGV